MTLPRPRESRFRAPKTWKRQSHKLLTLFAMVALFILWMNVRQYYESELAFGSQILPKKIGSPSAQAPRGLHVVLFLGLEGTGHHMWQELIKVSPAYQRLQELSIHPQLTKPLMQALYRHKNQRWNGLWSSTCRWRDEDPPANVTRISGTIVDILDNVKQRAKHSHHNVMVPINLLSGGDDFGVLSYPGFLKPCRPLMYPNLLVWNQICDTASVQCDYVYIHRNPYSVIQSTTVKRNFNNHNILEAIHLYTTHLHILHSQLQLSTINQGHRLLACLDYDKAISMDHFGSETMALLGFSSRAEGYDALKRVFKRPKEMVNGNASKEHFFPREVQPYMRAMVHIHKSVVETCHRFRVK